ncbi:DeoR/GlpR family DNA-binding transcription regulator [Labrys neptuniae]|uniref:DeoR/GlpR family DNA-binding transcription regulator n=1 Tax=Labrys neptuniae TaxID=376174 RepID=A0ABV3PEH4_9HYPH|nr:DeoR/GlpR family DNA-binding transcription regulator [Labrys neptuniae]MDT3378917.1 DeoR/GlpR family DNA-binding transcription regulator [Labrys neptuniae]
METSILLDAGLIPAERQRLLLQRIEQDGRIASVQAALDFAVSEDTIRRDLKELADAGLIERVHGGALRKSRASHRFDRRLISNEAQKKQLAAYALRFVEPGMVVLLDQSTSNLMLARQLPVEAGLTVITPSPDIAVAALDRGIGKLVLIGGQVDTQSRSASGAGALEQVAYLKPDLCFLGACAVDLIEGVTVVDHDDAHLKRAMVAASRSTMALVTAEKLDTRSTYQVMPFARLDRMVTENASSNTILQRYSESGVEIHLV